jgi:hypothetical protein
MFSTNGNKFYVSFLDAYSCYTWLFPISHKSDICSMRNATATYKFY